MKQKFLTICSIFSGLFLPVTFLYADDFKAFAERVIDLVNAGSKLLASLALLIFIIGVVRFIATAGDEKGRAEGRQLMLWGTIALFVMVAVWGLVAIIKTTFIG
jgi:hypothetical protein